MLWWMLQTSVVAAALTAVVATVCRLGRLCPAVQHVLWLVVLLKLATPNVAAWPWSIEQLTSSLHRAEIVAARETQHPDPITNSVGNSTEAETIASDPDSSLATRPLTEDERKLVQGVLVQPARSADISAKLGPGADIDRASNVVPAAAGQPPRAKPRKPLLDAQFVTRLLISLWVGGMLVYVARQGRRIVQFQRRLRTRRDVPAWLQQSVQKLSADLRYQPPRLLVARDVVSPCLWCVGSPQLVWPERLADDPQPARWQGVIVHELAHLKRRDHWVAWLELALGCVWWWNPVYWFVRRQLRETADLACDAWAVSVIADEQRVYAESLLEITTQLSRVPLAAPVLGASQGTRRSYQRRLEMIMSPPVPHRASFVGIVCAGLLAALAVPAWSLDDTPPPRAAGVPAAGTPAALPASGASSPGTPDPVNEVTRPTASDKPRTSFVKIDLEGRLTGRDKLTDAERLNRLEGELEGRLASELASDESSSSGTSDRLLGDDRDSTSAPKKLSDAERLDRLEGLLKNLIEELNEKSARRPVEETAPEGVRPPVGRGMGMSLRRSSDSVTANVDRREDSTTGLAQSLGGSQIDLIRLATEYSEATGAQKLAAVKLNVSENLLKRKFVSEDDLTLSKVAYETASKKVALLHAIAEATAVATEEDLTIAQKMFEAGRGGHSGISQLKAKLRVLSLILGNGSGSSTENSTGSGSSTQNRNGTGSSTENSTSGDAGASTQNRKH